MSKYTEAIKDMEDRLKYYEYCRDSEPRENLNIKEYFEDRIAKVKPLLEALQIADRLEQADAEKHSDDWFIRDDNSEFDRGYSIGFQEGYNTALADIRGDNNG